MFAMSQCNNSSKIYKMFNFVCNRNITYNYLRHYTTLTSQKVYTYSISKCVLIIDNFIGFCFFFFFMKMHTNKLFNKLQSKNGKYKKIKQLFLVSSFLKLFLLELTASYLQGYFSLNMCL